MVAIRLAGLAVQARRYRGTASASQDFEKHFARCAVSIPLAGYRALLQGERTRLMDPGSWARTQDNLGNTLFSLGSLAGDPKRLEEAIAAFLNVLKVLTHEDMPADWAMPQHNLQMTLKSLGALRKDASVLAEAKAAVPLALEIATDDENYKDTLQQIDAAIAALGT